MTTLVVTVLALAVLRWVARRAGRRDMTGLLFALLLLASIGSPASALNVESTSRPYVYAASPQSCVYAYDAELFVLQGRPLGRTAPASVAPLSSVDQRHSVLRPCPESLETRYDAPVLLRETRFGMATKGGGKTEIWRAVEPDELADLIGSGKYRPGPGNEGKYFFPTKAQAKNLADNILPGRKFCITSGCIDSSVLAKIDKIYPAGEGQAWFIPNELLPYIDDIVIHGPA